MSRILIVEDNELNREMLTRRLEHRGHEVIVATDGRQGVAVAQESHPDIVLMDLSLPAIDGWEATRLLKSAASTARIPVVALTAHAMVGDEQKALEAGCDFYATKPVDMPVLLAIIAKATAAKGQK
ncbi:MAG: response regulator [Bryobacteraceae bacterium]